MENCRTCKFASKVLYCPYAAARVDQCAPCEAHMPRETPLLADELGEALDAILSALTGAWFSYTRLPGRIEDAEIEARKLINRAERAVTRYQKEVGDEQEAE